MARHTMVVLTNPAAGREDEYNDWYNNRHLREVLATEGFVAATRFKLSDTEPPQEFTHRYLSLYEVETDDVAKAQLALEQASQSPDDMFISESLDTATAVARFFTPITDRVTSESFS